MNAIQPIEYFDDADFDPFTVDDEQFGEVEDVYSIIEQARAKGPVGEGSLLQLLGAPPDGIYGDAPQYYILGHKEVMQVLRDSEMFSVDALQINLGQTFGTTISAMNPPIHTKIRRYFQHIFFPGQVAKWSTTLVEPVINELIAKFEHRGHAELVDELAKPYPFEIIYRQLGLPKRDTLTFHRLSVSQVFIGEYFHYGVEASRKLGRYFTNLIEERRNSPGDDLVSILIKAEADGERLSDEIIISFFRQLIAAAGDTTYRTTGSMLIALLTNPEILEEVRNNRALIPQVLEETLRWNPPIIFTTRTAMRDMELGGMHIPKGAVLSVSLAAANNDPSVFENPRRFDIHRPARGHFGFGNGPHICVGQHLARLEMTRALTAVFDKLPNIRLDSSKPPPKITGGLLRTPRDVHVLFG